MLRRHFESQDCEFLSEMMREKGSVIHVDQCEPGRFDGVIDYSATTETQFYRVRFSGAICIHGAVPAGIAALALPATLADAAIFCGEAVTPRTLCVIPPGGECSYRTSARHGILGACLAERRLARALHELHHTTLESVLSRTANLPISPAAIARLRAAIQGAFTPPDLDLVRKSESFDREVEDTLLAAFCAALVAPHTHRSSRLAARNHWRYVRLARDYVETHLGDNLGIETLCKVSEVSERTLETAFRKVTGCTPHRFIKLRRLHAARRAIAQARPEETSVKAIALGYGFRHLGRFSRDYRAHFGKSPSAELRQP